MITIERVRAQLNIDKVKNIGDEGKNSDVWIAHDTQLDEQIVLKVITKQSLDEQKVMDYFLESKLLNDSTHPHIMPVRYAAEDDNNIYITMPYYHKGSINQLIDNRMLSTKEVIAYGLDFLSGLHFIHIKGMLHLDIKPTNIIINDYGRAVVTDFGLSRYLDEKGFANQNRTYVPHATPEVFFTNDRTIQDDIYQAGLTLYRMCYGNEQYKLQFEVAKDNFREYIIEGAFPNRNFTLPHISKQLRRVIKKALEVKTEKRYKTILSMMNDLAKIDVKNDWKFDILNKDNHYSWSNTHENGNVETYEIKLQSDKWNLSGKKYINSSRRTTNNNKIKESFDDLNSAFKKLEILLA